jgi:predicted O-linked N-acetylglucosamine transferase (SPINDLY family)
MPALTLQQVFDLALQQHQAGRIAEAEALYRQILVVNPNHARAQNNLGSILAARKLWAEASEAFSRALDSEPTNAEIHHNVGLSMMELGRVDQAVTEFRKAVEIQPDHARAYSGLGNALRSRGELDAALAACSTAVKLAPGLTAAQNNLGTVLHNLGRFDEAIAAYCRAIHLEPSYAEARINLADAFRSTGRLDESIHESSIALQQRPDLAEAANNLGNALKDAGRIEDAITVYRRALQAKPSDFAIRSNLIHVLQFSPERIATESLAELRAYNAKVNEHANPIVLPRFNHLDPDRCLRIGYVSPEFRDHVTGRYLRPLFAFHDHQNFEIISYSGVLLQDSLTEEFRGRSHLWRNTVGVPDETLTETILADRIDILVDLTQHLAGNRLPVFARKPAPLQVSFAGYPESTGLETIENRISDSYLECGISGLGRHKERHEDDDRVAEILRERKGPMGCDVVKIAGRAPDDISDPANVFGEGTPRVFKTLATLGWARRMGLEAGEGHHFRFGLFSHLRGVQRVTRLDGQKGILRPDEARCVPRNANGY